MEMLKGNNWMLWKRQMLAILWDLLLETYIDRDSKPPTPADPQKVTDAEKEAAKKWCEGDAKARTCCRRFRNGSHHQRDDCKRARCGNS
jgi:hypothetical protein